MASIGVRGDLQVDDAGSGLWRGAGIALTPGEKKDAAADYDQYYQQTDNAYN